MDKMYFTICVERASSRFIIDITGYIYHFSSDGTPFISYWLDTMQSPDEYITLNLIDYSVYFIILP